MMRQIIRKWQTKINPEQNDVRSPELSLSFSHIPPVSSLSPSSSPSRSRSASLPSLPSSDHTSASLSSQYLSVSLSSLQPSPADILSSPTPSLLHSPLNPTPSQTLHVPAHSTLNYNSTTEAVMSEQEPKSHFYREMLSIQSNSEEDYDVPSNHFIKFGPGRWGKGAEKSQLIDNWKIYFELYGRGLSMMDTPELKLLIRCGIPDQLRAQGTYNNKSKIRKRN